MQPATFRERLLLNEDLNFLLTNRVPRHALTRFMGWYSHIHSPMLTRMSITIWRWFTQLDFSDAQTTGFDSLHACFTRRLKPGARPFATDPHVVCSPSDGIVGACGRIQGTQVFQAKGLPYTLTDLLGSDELAERHADGVYVTLRLTSAMYHRFHAPTDLVVRRVTYHSGDTWNVNPVALARIERLFCRNERAVIETRLPYLDTVLTLVPVAAILVASIRLHALDTPALLRSWAAQQTGGTADLNHSHACGDEMGWFEHGSTIIVLAPRGFSLSDTVSTGQVLRAGQPLLRWADPGA
jgi:phosphatidylserine decarboxylase